MQNAMTLYKPLPRGAYITRSGNSYLPLSPSDFVTTDHDMESDALSVSSCMVHNVPRFFCHNVLFQTRSIHNVLFLNSQELWYIMFHKCNILGSPLS